MPVPAPDALLVTPGDAQPVLLHVPHAGTLVPDWVRTSAEDDHAEALREGELVVALAGLVDTIMGHPDLGAVAERTPAGAGDRQTKGS